MITTLDKICSLGGGAGFPDRYQGSRSGDYPFIKVSDMNLVGNERYIRRANNYLNEVDRQELGAKVFQNGATVFAKVGAALNLNRRRQLLEDTLIDNNMMAAIPNRARVLPEYLFYALSRVDLGQISQVGSVPSVNQEQVGSIRVFCPDSLSEQKAIVEILSDCDATIDAISRKIKAKEQAYQSVCQRALSQANETRALTDVATIQFSNVDKKEYDGQQQAQLCNYTDVFYNDFITSDLDFMKSTVSEVERTKFTLCIGDVLFTKDSETPEEIAVSSVVSEKIAGLVCGYHLGIARPKDIDGGYLGVVFKSFSVRKQFSRLANGATRFGLNLDSMHLVKIPILPKAKQTLLAEISLGHSKEIRLMSLQLEAAKNQKRGLMQQLLTGKLRVREAA